MPIWVLGIAERELFGADGNYSERFVTNWGLGNTKRERKRDLRDQTDARKHKSGVQTSFARPNGGAQTHIGSANAICETKWGRANTHRECEHYLRDQTDARKHTSGVQTRFASLNGGRKHTSGVRTRFARPNGCPQTQIGSANKLCESKWGRANTNRERKRDLRVQMGTRKHKSGASWVGSRPNYGTEKQCGDVHHASGSSVHYSPKDEAGEPSPCFTLRVRRGRGRRRFRILP